MYKVLKISRVAVQLTLLTVITWALMATPTLLVNSVRGGIEHWQLIPMSMLGGLSAVGVWLVLTLVFGRIYCSTVCPLGTLQDIASRIPRLNRHHRPYRYKPSQPWFVRGAMITILVMAVCFESLAVSWSILPFLQVSPYDSYSLIVTEAVVPMADYISGQEVVPVPLRLAIPAIINLVFLVSIAAVRGREVCNTLCPVGGALGAVSVLSWLHFDIDTDRCTHCRRCEDVCKAMCIDSSAGTVDASRCVVCFDCVAACPDDAIHYTTRRHRLSLPMLQSIKPPKPVISSSLESSMQSNLTKKTQNNETIS